jgi:hypothetical protein
MLRSALAACVLFVATPAGAVADEHCVALVQDDDGIQAREAPGFRVRGADPLVRPEGVGNVVALMCDREALVPDVGDFRVVTELSLPFNIRSGGRIIVLEISNGQLRVRFLRGELTEEERTALQAAMNEAQLILQREPAEAVAP